jgi:hypothetical protein
LSKDTYSVVKDYESLRKMVECLISDINASNSDLEGSLNYLATGYNDQLEQFGIKKVEYHSFITAIYSHTADCIYVYAKIDYKGNPVYGGHDNLKHIHTIEGRELPIAVEDLTTDQLVCYVEENYDVEEWL